MSEGTAVEAAAAKPIAAPEKVALRTPELLRPPLSSEQRDQEWLTRSAVADKAEHTANDIQSRENKKPANVVEGELQTFNALNGIAYKDDPVGWKHPLEFTQGKPLEVVWEDAGKGKGFYRHAREKDNPNTKQKITRIYGANNGWFQASLEGGQGMVEIDADLVLDLQAEAVISSQEAFKAEMAGKNPPETVPDILHESVTKVAHAFFAHERNDSTVSQLAEKDTFDEALKETSAVSAESLKAEIAKHTEIPEETRKEMEHNLDGKRIADGKDLADYLRATGGNPNTLADNLDSELRALEAPGGPRDQALKELHTVMSSGSDIRIAKEKFDKIEANIHAKRNLKDMIEKNGDKLDAAYESVLERSQKGGLPAERCKVIYEKILSGKPEDVEMVIKVIIEQKVDDKILGENRKEKIKKLMMQGGFAALLMALLAALELKGAFEQEEGEKQGGMPRR